MTCGFTDPKRSIGGLQVIGQAAVNEQVGQLPNCNARAVGTAVGAELPAAADTRLAA